MEWSWITPPHWAGARKVERPSATNERAGQIALRIRIPDDTNKPGASCRKKSRSRFRSKEQAPVEPEVRPAFARKLRRGENPKSPQENTKPTKEGKIMECKIMEAKSSERNRLPCLHQKYA